MNAGQALAFVEQHGVVLVSAKGPAPRLTEAIIGEPISGSWWGHAQSHRIFEVLNGVTDSPHVLVCRLINGKLTLVHSRLWPALVRLADRLQAEQIARVEEEHTASGKHVSRSIPFPDWVAPQILAQGRAMDEGAALAELAMWVKENKS